MKLNQNLISLLKESLLTITLLAIIGTNAYAASGCSLMEDGVNCCPKEGKIKCGAPDFDSYSTWDEAEARTAHGRKSCKWVKNVECCQTINRVGTMLIECGDYLFETEDWDEVEKKLP